MTTKDRPILFSAPMVRALLDGSKTQTRRVVKRSDEWPASAVKAVMLESRGTALAVAADRCTYGPEISCPYGQPGDRLWVRESWSTHAGFDRYAPSELTHIRSFHYWADGHLVTGKKRPSIHMPRWASRITLEITGVRVERLQDISPADAEAEGIEPQADGIGWKRGPISGDHPNTAKRTAFPKLAYQSLWESINSPDSWAANPWVWVIEFKKASQ